MSGFFVIKTEIRDRDAAVLAFPAQKTVYGGKLIGVGDTLFIFARENEGGQGLFARGTVESVEPVARPPNVPRQTPRVSVTVGCLDKPRKRLDRAELRTFRTWKDGRPQTELNFKLYRQATDKIVGVTSPAAAFLQDLFGE
jgi:hypothetical protein